jgi:predicted nucleotidyltransferase
MHPQIAQHSSAITAICRRYRVRRLDVFGSAARETDFMPASSDADFLVEFAPDATPDFRVFFGVKSELEQLLGRPVDLIEADAVRNPYLQRSINRDRSPVYVA